MYKKRPEMFGAFAREASPDTSKEEEKSDWQKYVEAVKLFSETTDLYERNRRETLEVLEELLTKAHDLYKDYERLTSEKEAESKHLKVIKLVTDLVDKNEEQINIWTKQHEKCADLFPDEFSKLKANLEKHNLRASENQPANNDALRTLQSLTDEEIKKFTV